MASKLSWLQSRAVEASRLAYKEGGKYVKQLVEQNKHHVQEPATAEKCLLLSKQLFYTRLASIPRRYEAFWKELDQLKQTWKNSQPNEMNAEDAKTAALFGLELLVCCWAGKVVGRGFTFTGYYV
ncbi:hypothetical protein Tsubulata_013208 [Turnera subulata]|uniref:Uncharacterized protein n=1 Tax=Turnera subulata TaxID=218843 RepID=A0A9Q0J9E4_9ROSI|nr:hypothetical protein Tsubulata_013208 [Turnera subulata]